MSLHVGVICYDNPHLKTEQVVTKFLRNPEIGAITLFALPFTPRKAREVQLNHRPDQTQAVMTRHLAANEQVSFQDWDGQADLGECDVYVITGAGIIDVAPARGKPIINAHPGIIPAVRGLDAFKWSIYEGTELGVTLHYIDEQVDSGELITIETTMVYADDTIETLARRHYENEIDILGNFTYYLKHQSLPVFEEQEAHMRMPVARETEMLARFDDYKTKFAR